MPGKFVYFFGDGVAEGGREDKALLGGKGANLGEMMRIGVPVPPFFTLTTEACRYYLRENHYPPGMEAQVTESLRRLEQVSGKRFGDDADPLLVSVRSGAATLMPGMMETILNLGLNDRTVEALGRAASNRRFAFDSYRRFVQMYAEVVMGVPADAFERVLDDVKHAHGAKLDTDLGVEPLEELVTRFKALVRERSGALFPDDPGDAAVGCDRGGLPFVERGTRHCLPPRARHSRLPGHRGQCGRHGLRQSGR